jgi:hypothetical protein
MTAQDPVTSRVAAVLRGGLTAASGAGASSVAAEHLVPGDLETLADATLDHLRSRPGGPSAIEGWTLVSARDAAVMAWWVRAAELTTGERRRLEPLRQDLYDLLAERALVVRDEEQRTSLHVSPAAPETDEAMTGRAVTGQDVPSGAWVLKLSPYLYDVNHVFGAADRRVRAWSVEDPERSASMQDGDPVYLWVGDGDPYRAAGIWGIGHVAGPTVLGVADEGWLDYEAATRATVFAVVDVTLLDVPVSRAAFLEDARLTGSEVVRDPFAPNPAVLTAVELEALSEHLARVATAAGTGLADEQVA